MNMQPQQVATEQLFFDIDNPRLVEFSKDEMSSDEKILNILWSQMAVDEIVQSILSNGFFQNEALLAVEENGKTVVVEGNRRLAAVKAILHPELVKGMSRYVGRITDQIRDDLQTLPVIKIRERSESWTYIGFKHVNGPSKWGSYAKAQYIATVHNNFGVSLDEISQQIGDNNKTVLKLYQGLMVIEQAENQTDFRRDDISAKRLYFSHLYTGLQSPGFKKYLGLGETPAEDRSPVPDDKIKHLENVMLWLYGSKRQNISSLIVSQNPDLGKLADILKDDLATLTLEARTDLDYAYDVAIGTANLFRNSLLTAKNELQKAMSNVNGYKREDSLLTAARDIASLAESLVQLMENKKNKVEKTEQEKKSHYDVE